MSYISLQSFQVRVGNELFKYMNSGCAVEVGVLEYQAYASFTFWCQRKGQ